MLFEEYAFRPQIVQDAPHAIVLRVRAGVKCRRGHVLSEERRERTVSNSILVSGVGQRNENL
jgi:hypothetical protein